MQYLIICFSNWFFFCTCNAISDNVFNPRLVQLIAVSNTARLVRHIIVKGNLIYNCNNIEVKLNDMLNSDQSTRLITLNAHCQLPVSVCSVLSSHSSLFPNL
jgi:hypothetical protein